MSPIKKCEACGGPMRMRAIPGRTTRDRFSRRRFCNWQCFIEWAKRSRRDKRCENCGAELPSEKYAGQRFCNRQCSSDWRAANMTEEARQKQRELLNRLRERPDFQAKHAAYVNSKENRAKLGEIGRKGLEALRLADFPTLIRRNGAMPIEPTVPQKTLFEALPGSIMEYPVREGIQGAGWRIDLALVPLKLAIEVDGDSHNNPRARKNDQKKDRALELRGWTVLRFQNREILRDLSSVLRRIHATVASLEAKRDCPAIQLEAGRS